MAEFLNLSYTYVALAAVTPALLYYIGLLLAVHFEAKRLGLSGIARENIPDALSVIKEQGHLVLPLVSLIGLMFTGFTPLYAAVISIFITVAASWLRKETRMTGDKIIAAVIEGARSAVSVGVCCVIIGVIIGTVTLTSMGLHMGYLILSLLQDNNVYLAGFLVMIMSAVLGWRSRRCGVCHCPGGCCSCPYQGGGAASYRPHVLPDLCLPFQYHAACGHVSLCGIWDCRF